MFITVITVIMITANMFLIDLLFPKFCLGCGYIGVYVCSSCLKKLEPMRQDFCLYCKRPSLYGLTHPSCISKFNVDGIVSLYHYNPILKKIIKNIKYRLATEVWKDFHSAIAPMVIDKLSLYKRLCPDFVIQPIPLSKIKYNERGFNQAKFISIYFQNFLHFPIVDLLIRKGEASSQAQTKNKWNRYLNVRGTFVINNKHRDVINHVSTNVMLIDDVVTSGSTIKEAARILKQANVKRVYVLALAKG